MFRKKQLILTLFFVVLSYLWLNKVKRGPVYESDKSLKGKTVLITGGNVGIGKETALLLAKKDAKIIIASRNVKKSMLAQAEIIKTTGNKNIEVSHLDLADFNNVKQFAQNYLNTEKHLDILINNAGASDLPGLLPSGINKMFAVNHFGHFLLTNLLLDKMKAQSQTRPVRIINLSSGAYKGGSKLSEDYLYYNPNSTYELMRVYCATKLANIYFTMELNERLKDYDGITTYSVHPGAITSELGMNFWWPIKLLIKYVLSPLAFRSPYYGAQTTLYCALDDDVVEYSGAYFSNCKLEELYEVAGNETLQKVLWKKSVEITGFEGK